MLPAFDYGGTEKMVATISEQLVAKGHQIKILVFYPGRASHMLPQDVEIAYCENIRLCRKILGKSRVELDTYYKAVDSFKPDIIHSHSFYTDRIMLQRGSEKAKLFSHWHLERDALAVKRFFALKSKKNLSDYIDRLLMLRQLKQQKVQFLSISSYTTEYHKEVLPQNFWPCIHYLPNAINCSDQNYERSIDRNDILKLVSVGRLTRDKNYEFLLDIAMKLKARKVKFNLDIYGEGEERQYLEKLIENKRVSDCVVLKGYLSDIKKALSSYDIYVHSADRENFGLSILEASSLGLPVISINVGGIKDVIINNENGILINHNYHDDFIGAILRLKEDTNLYNNMSKAGRLLAKRFSIEIYIDKLLSIYENA